MWLSLGPRVPSLPRPCPCPCPWRCPGGAHPARCQPGLCHPMKGRHSSPPKPLLPVHLWRHIRVCVTTHRHTGHLNTPAQLVCTNTDIYRCFLIGSPALRVFSGQNPWFPGTPPVPWLPRPIHLGTCSPHAFALPTGPWCGHHCVPARADALLQVRREGCGGDADLVGFFYEVCRNDLGKGNQGEGGDQR